MLILPCADGDGSVQVARAERVRQQYEEMRAEWERAENPAQGDRRSGGRGDASPHKSEEYRAAGPLDFPALDASKPTATLGDFMVLPDGMQ